MHRTLLTDPQSLSPENELTPRETSSHLRFQADQIIKTNRKASFRTSEIVPRQDENLKLGKDNEAKEGARC